VADILEILIGADLQPNAITDIKEKIDKLIKDYNDKEISLKLDANEVDDIVNISQALSNLNKELKNMTTTQKRTMVNQQKATKAVLDTSKKVNQDQLKSLQEQKKLYGEVDRIQSTLNQKGEQTLKITKKQNAFIKQQAKIKGGKVTPTTDINQGAFDKQIKALNKRNQELQETGKVSQQDLASYQNSFKGLTIESANLNEHLERSDKIYKNLTNKVTALKNIEKESAKARDILKQYTEDEIKNSQHLLNIQTQLKKIENFDNVTKDKDLGKDTIQYLAEQKKRTDALKSSVDALNEARGKQEQFEKEIKSLKTKGRELEDTEKLSNDDLDKYRNSFKELTVDSKDFNEQVERSDKIYKNLNNKATALKNIEKESVKAREILNQYTEDEIKDNEHLLQIQRQLNNIKDFKDLENRKDIGKNTILYLEEQKKKTDELKASIDALNNAQDRQEQVNKRIASLRTKGRELQDTEKLSNDDLAKYQDSFKDLTVNSANFNEQVERADKIYKNLNDKANALKNIEKESANARQLLSMYSEDEIKNNKHLLQIQQQINKARDFKDLENQKDIGKNTILYLEEQKKRTDALKESVTALINEQQRQAQAEKKLKSLETKGQDLEDLDRLPQGDLDKYRNSFKNLTVNSTNFNEQVERTEKIYKNLTVKANALKNIEKESIKAREILNAYTQAEIQNNQKLLALQQQVNKLSDFSNLETKKDIGKNNIQYLDEQKRRTEALKKAVTELTQAQNNQAQGGQSQDNQKLKALKALRTKEQDLKDLETLPQADIDKYANSFKNLTINSINFTDQVERSEKIYKNLNNKATALKNIEKESAKARELLNEYSQQEIQNNKQLLSLQRQLNNMTNFTGLESRRDIGKNNIQYLTEQKQRTDALKASVDALNNARDKQEQTERKLHSLRNKEQDLKDTGRLSKDDLDKYTNSFKNLNANSKDFNEQVERTEKIYKNLNNKATALKNIEKESANARQLLNMYTAEEIKDNQHLLQIQQQLNKLSNFKNVENRKDIGKNNIRYLEIQKERTDALKASITALGEEQKAQQKAEQEALRNRVAEIKRGTEMPLDGGNARARLSEIGAMDTSSIQGVRQQREAMKEWVAEVLRLEHGLNGLTSEMVQLKPVTDAHGNTIYRVITQYERGNNQLQEYIHTLDLAGNRMDYFNDNVRRTGTGPLQMLGNAMQRIPIYMASMGVFYSGINQFTQGIQTIYEIDKAMTNLEKVTEATESQMEQFVGVANQIGQELGALTKDVINATAEFQKLGYTLEQSQSLAEQSIVYGNVGDMGVGEASETLLASLRGFGVGQEQVVMESKRYVDMFNEVGNNYAISSAGIGQALQRSSAILHVAGNSVEESIALITSANATIQDPKKVGNALTYSAFMQ
jgi:hypothetical protein